MSFNIEEFRSNVNRLGLAKSNLFFVSVTTPGQGEGERDLKFMCKTVSVPGLNLSTTEYYNQGFGARELRPTGLPFDNLSTVFMVDKKFTVKRYFQSWLQNVVNFNGADLAAETYGALPFETGYKKDYTGTVSVYVYSINSKDFEYIYKFENAYPIALGELSLAWENGSEIMSLPVSFAYDGYTVKDAFKQSTPTGRTYGRTNGPSGYIAAMDLFAGAISAINAGETTARVITNQLSNAAKQLDNLLRF